MVGAVCNGIELNEQTSVLVRDRRTGKQRLETKEQLFFPTADEDIVEVRKLQTLADYEVLVLKDRDGAFSFRHGGSGAPGSRSFFVPPYSEVVKLVWSRGRRREKRDLCIERIDCRPQYMSFEFNCRTSDNVELVLEGTFFWQIVDVPLMIQNTGDASGDVCNHARSQFIQLIARISLQEFMNSFNEIARKAHVGDDQFYTSRGVKIHTLEVTGYRCADDSTAKILEVIVQETTNRMNRLSQQESENEVLIHRLKGEIDQAKLNSELLEIQHAQRKEEARIHGMAEAEKVLAFVAGLESAVPSLQERLDLWRVLRKQDALLSVSQGPAHLYFTPSDCNLSIEHHEHSGRHTAVPQIADGQDKSNE
eukprot:c15283_g1_i2.p1 GENE.c15283_g1_i2~~c15283_g1_i2.p1  ORF type:complete len:365 (+),score=96.09 c15283_g1_i2:848-1942(+)